MEKNRIAFKVLTALFCVGMLPGAVMNILQPEMVLEMTTILGIPPHLLTLMGIWKVLGIAALALPNMAKLKEWAYAGFFFDLTGAAFLHGAVGDFAGIAPSLLLAALLMTSYFLRRGVVAQA